MRLLVLSAGVMLLSATAGCDAPRAPAGEVPAVVRESPASASAQASVARAYVEPAPCGCDGVGLHGDVHVVYADGREATITRDGMAFGARVAPDGATVGYLAVEHLDDVRPPGKMAIGSRLVLFRDGRVLREIAGDPFLRAWGFLASGREVGVEVGALHFAGTLLRFNVASGAQLEAVWEGDVPYEDRPDWSKALE